METRTITKIKYTALLIIAFIATSGIAYLGYWLLAVYKLQSLIGVALVLLFIAFPLIKVITLIPREIRILFSVWESESPQEVIDAAAYLRERSGG